MEIPLWTMVFKKTQSKISLVSSWNPVLRTLRAKLIQIPPSRRVSLSCHVILITIITQLTNFKMDLKFHLKESWRSFLRLFKEMPFSKKLPRSISFHLIYAFNLLDFTGKSSQIVVELKLERLRF